MFELEGGDIAGLVIGFVLSVLFLVILFVWRLRCKGEEGSPELKFHLVASRGLAFLFAIVVVALVSSSQVSEPQCFFGFTFGLGEESACEFGVAIASTTIVYTAGSVVAIFLFDVGHYFAIADLLFSAILGVLWLVVGIMFAVLVQRRKDRCDDPSCEPAGAYPRALAAVNFAFISFLAAILHSRECFLAVRVQKLHQPVVSRINESLILFVEMAFAAIVSSVRCDVCR